MHLIVDAFCSEALDGKIFTHNLGYATLPGATTSPRPTLRASIIESPVPQMTPHMQLEAISSQIALGSDLIRGLIESVVLSQEAFHRSHDAEAYHNESR